MATAQGHPDFQSLVLWRGAPLVSQAFSVTTATPLTADAWVSNFSSLQVYATADTGKGVAVLLTYYTDSTKATVAGSQSWQLWQCSVQATVPILAPYVEVEVRTVNAGTMTGTIYVAPSNVAVSRTTYTAGFLLVASQSESVAANATNSHQLADIAVGQVWLQARPGDTSGKLQLQVHELDDAGNVVGTVAENDSYTGAVSLQGAARERVLRLDIFNGDGAAAHTTSYRLAILPG